MNRWGYTERQLEPSKEPRISESRGPGTSSRYRSGTLEVDYFLSPSMGTRSGRVAQLLCTDTGNMEVLKRVGTPSRRPRAEPLLRGEIGPP